MDIITLALAKKFATKVAAGFSNVEVDGLNIIFTLNDGSKVTLTVPEPAQGVSVVDMNIDDDGSLICTLSDGTTIDAGGVPFVKPERGVDYLTDAEMEGIINDIIEDSTNAFNQNVNQKTTIFDEHAADKIDEYDEHASELTNRIEYLEDEVNDLSDNQLIAEEEGTEIYVTDAAKARLNDFRFTKESSQITTTGKNKFNYQDLVNKIEAFTIEGNNRKFTIVGGNDATYSYPINLTGQQIITGSWSSTKLNGNIAVVYEDDSVDNFVTLYTSGSGNGIINFTTDGTKNIKQIRFKTWGNANNITINDLMISTTATDYEPYTDGEASPSPNYPQDVEVVEGYENLFNQDNVEFILGILDDNGQPTGSTGSHYTDNYYNVNSSTEYSLSGTLSNAGTTTRIYFYDVNKNWISRTGTLSGNFVNFVTPINCKYIRIQVANVITLATNNVLLTSGNKLLPYVPYGNNYVGITFKGKNLFDKDNVVNGYLLENGTIGAATSYKTSDYIPILPNTNYYKTRTGSPRCKYYDINKQPLNTTTYQDIDIGTYEGSFITPANAYYVRLSIYPQTISLNDVQLEKGSVATPYEPYKESIVSIPLNGNFIGGISNYKDTLIVDKLGKCYLNKKIGKYIFDGSENWIGGTAGSSSPLYRYIYCTGIPYTPISFDCISNMFVAYTSSVIGVGTITDKNIIGVQKSNSNNVRVMIHQDYLSDISSNSAAVNSFKDLLSSKNAILYLPLAQEDLINLHYTIDLKTFKGVNNITNSENANMKIKYVQDINSIINEIKNTLSS